MNNREILNKIDEIISKIEQSDNYLKYLDLKDKINKNNELKLLINEIKVLQKDIVHHINKKDLLNSKLKELEENPIYREYNNTIYEINSTYSIIENELNNYFNNKLN